MKSAHIENAANPEQTVRIADQRGKSDPVPSFGIKMQGTSRPYAPVKLFRGSLFADDGDDGRTAVRHPAADALGMDQEGNRGLVFHQRQHKKKLLLPLVLFQKE